MVIKVGGLRVREDGGWVGEVEGGRSGVNEVVSFEEVDGVVEGGGGVGVGDVGSEDEVGVGVGGRGDKGMGW